MIPSKTAPREAARSFVSPGGRLSTLLTNHWPLLAVCGLAAAWVHRGLAWVALAWLVGNLAGGVAAVLPLMRCMRGTRRKHVAPGAPR